jgi:amidohydrolase
MSASGPKRLGTGGPQSRNGAEAIVTLDFVDADPETGKTPAYCFCVDCFSDEADTSTRLDRVLSHVSPTSSVPRDLLAGLKLRNTEDGYYAHAIPWCAEVQASATFATSASAGRQVNKPKWPLKVTRAAGSSGKQAAHEAIDALAAELDALAMELHGHPEVGYEEVFAHGLVCDFLEAQGFAVQRSYLGVQTAFRAEFSRGAGPTVGIMCEYDALPGIGHACGHNLIAEAACAAFMGVKACMDAGEGSGTLAIFGTPAEEQNGGKIELLNRHAFDDVDVAMMVHPSPGMMLYPGMLAREMLMVDYTGVNAHAASNPWNGVNALDATIQAYNNVAMMRQQMKPSWRVHGVVTNGGTEPNIIPAESQSKWYIRAPNMEDLADLHAKVEGCMKAAAQSTGCEVSIEWQGDHAIFDHDEYEKAARTYGDIKTNETLAECFRGNWDALGTELTFRAKSEDLALASQGGGSSDMGNITHIMPGIHPAFRIETQYGNHHPGFTECPRPPGAVKRP